LKEKRLSILYILFPLATMIIVLPPISESPPFYYPDHLGQIAIVIPFYLGLLSAPGYIYAWSGHYKKSALSPNKRRWVILSLVGGVIASLGGLISILTIIAIPSAIGSIICSVLLLVKYLRS
jgi:hypothetical protein